MPLQNRKLAVIGAGNMGSAFVKGIVKGGFVPAGQITATSLEPERLEALATLGARTASENRSAVQSADVVLLCVKPQALRAVASECQGVLGADTLLISILAGVTTQRLNQLFGEDLPVVRAMPNIPAQVDEAATAICAGAHADEVALSLAEAVFGAVGTVARVPEQLMDAVTGLSGSGPAYIYMVIEALTDGGVQMGLPRSAALELATQTVLGSAKLVKETGLHPAILRDQVTTPGGTTIHAIHELEARGLRAMLSAAVVTATERSRQLNELNGD
jgi:pyrroline-5-carboxylate reductase